MKEAPDLKEQLGNAFKMGSRISRSTVAVIDTLVQRGAFKGEELTTIGTLRDQAVQLIQMAEAHAADGVAAPDKKAPPPPQKK
tara:strand:- start:3303 stop:3551 length:249 start_codon:yes stop_codon:yes gene_type:complete